MQERYKALRAVLEERDRQENKWGEQNHNLFIYLSILTEEVGELSEVALHNEFGGKEAGREMEEAIHVAAVALAIVEMLIRKENVEKEK